MRKNQWRNFVGIASLSFILGLGTVAAPMSVSAATEHWNDATLTGTEGSWEDYKKNWEETRDNWKHVSLTPGKNESELNFAWYSTTKETPMVKIATDKAMKEGVKEFKGTQEELSSDEKSRSDINGYYSNKVEVTGLEENTEYYYQVFQDGEWKEPQSYKTESFSSYSFLYVGDPQVGACKGQTDSQGNEMTKTKPDYLAARNDSYNWNEILNQAVDKHPDVSFMVSAGDQVNYADEEREYAGYLGAEALTSLPVATTIGNHDSGSAQYSWHFNNPNTQEDAGDAYTEGRTQAGTDYYFTYGDVLFIFIDTNNYNCATHENVIKKAVEENQDKKWRVVTFHQDIYGSGKDHSDTDGMVLRTQLTPIMDKYDIDVVLQGHDHTYSRTYQLVSDGKEHGAYTKGNYEDNLGDFQADNNCYEIVSDVKGGTVTNPEGTVYFEANSATGSKFYELIPSQQDFIAERSQTWTPTYSVIDVTEDTFSVTTYDSTTQEKLEGSDTYTIKKTKNQESQDDKNQESQDNQNQESQDDKNQESQDDKNQESQDDKNQESQDNQNQESQDNQNQESQDDKNQESQDDKNQESQDDKNQESQSDKKQDAQATTQAPQATTQAPQAAAQAPQATTQAPQQTAAAEQTTQNAPKKVKAVKTKRLPGSKVRVSWKRDKKASGYQVSYSYKKKFNSKVKHINIKKNKKNKVVLSKLTKGKKVFVKVRSYKKVDGKKVYGAYSKVSKIKIK